LEKSVNEAELKINQKLIKSLDKKKIK